MTLISTVPPDKAHGEIQRGYEVFTKRGVAVPLPLQLLSVSPELFKIMIQRNQYYANHPHLGFTLLTHIRFMVANRLDYGFCKAFNKRLLVMQGADPDRLEQMGTDPDQSLLEENERLMLAFVLRAMEDPDGVTLEDIEALHHVGWTDTDIFDALAQGVGMIDHSIFMRVFKPETTERKTVRQ